MSAKPAAGHVAAQLPADPARRAFDVRVRPTEARIDASALSHNLREAKRKAKGARVLGVVKADGYGHGAVIEARAFLSAGADRLGVAPVEEGLALRHAGIVSPILCLGAQYTDYALVLGNRLTPVVYRKDQIDALAAAARTAGVVAEAHLKLDTGMGRIGVMPAELSALLAHARGIQEGLRPGQPLPLCHLATSAATLDLPAAPHDMIRPGLMLYGAVPAPRFAGLADLRPALTWTTAISHLKVIPAGTPISYGHKWTARRESVIATLPVGYADGYRRALGNVSFGLLGGKRCPVAGTVCMDMFMVDATEVPSARIGDEVVLLGKQGGEQIAAEELADRCGTIAYEVFCNISARVPRVAV